MTTEFASRQLTAIHNELAQRLAKYKAQYGETFQDVILVSPNKHGVGRVGFSCTFSGRQTAAGGTTLVEFARRVFGTGGKLVRIDDGKYAVLK